jgi:hypothetical protein
MESILPKPQKKERTSPTVISWLPKWGRWIVLVGLVGVLGASTYFVVKAR